MCQYLIDFLSYISQHSYMIYFILSAVNYFWTTLSFFLLFAYPAPELPTPSFEYHTAFNGVALGIVRKPLPPEIVIGTVWFHFSPKWLKEQYFMRPFFHELYKRTF